MNIRRTVIAVLLVGILLGGAATATAQTDSGGQFCVKAFEDRDGNQQLDGGEPFLTRGVGAQLLDANGLIVATALIDNSPTAAQGVICFTGLAYGQYTIVVTSPDYTRSTPDSMTVSINAGELPEVFLFGAKRIEAPASTGGAGSTELSPDEQTALLERVVIAAGAALIVVVIMLALGLIIYLMAFRSRLERAVPDVYMSPRVTTGSHPAVRASDSGEYPKLGG